MSKFIRIFFITFLCAGSLVLGGCLAGGDGDGDDGLRWSPIPDGGGLWGNVFSMYKNNDFDCKVIDADGDGSADDSSLVALSFDDQVYTGSYAVRVYLNKIDCKDAGDPNKWDYADQFKFSYLASSGKTEYNIMDLNITDVNRYIETNDARDALNGASVCGVTTWATGAEHDVTGCTGTNDDIYTGFSLNENGAIVYLSGMNLEGVYHVVADDLSFQMDAVGARPDGNAIINNPNFKR